MVEKMFLKRGKNILLSESCPGDFELLYPMIIWMINHASFWQLFALLRGKI